MLYFYTLCKYVLMLDIFLSIYGYSEEEEEEMEYTGQDYYYESCAQSTACDFMMPFHAILRDSHFNH